MFRETVVGGRLINRNEKGWSSVWEGLRQLYHGPVRNEDFSLAKSLASGVLWAGAYGFVFYWLTLFLGGTEHGAWIIAVVGFLSGYLATVASDKWKVGYALGDLVQPVLLGCIFLISFYLLV